MISYMKVLVIVIVLIEFSKANVCLGDGCTDNWSCSHIVDSECSNGICSCIFNTIVHDGACVQISQPEKFCTTDLECKETADERRICVNNKCRCIPYHHMLDGTCTKNRGLHEHCLRNKDCYWGQDMIDKMECKGHCSCKSGYIPFHGRKCISEAYKNAPVSFSRMILFITSFMALLEQMF